MVDEHSQKLLSSVLKQYDILEENVTCTLPFLRAFLANLTGFQVVETITSNRDSQPHFDAMYLLMPTTQNIDRIIRDFSNNKQYAGAHLFFIDGMQLNC